MEQEPDLFANENEGYPNGKFKPLHKAFKGRGRVLKSSAPAEGSYLVDLGTGECECNWGAAFYYNGKRKRWEQNSYCVHKLRAMADIVQRHLDNGEDLTWFYVKAVSTRYNIWEVKSTFHKELRRGDATMAYFWASIFAGHRGLAGVIDYLLHIGYEEHRDHALLQWLFSRLQDKKNLTIADVCNGVIWTCKVAKKWELPHRMPLFEGEMRAYAELVKRYGTVVAKSEAIDPGEYATLAAELVRGITGQNPTTANIGLKGLQRLKPHPVYGDLQGIRRQVFTVMWNAAQTCGLVTPEIKKLYEWNVYKGENHEYRYHDLNAFLDLLMGEPYGAGMLTPAERKRILSRPSLLALPLGRYPQIPLYAQDNHTYLGKSLIRRFPGEVKAGAVQHHIDLKFCGAYLGVAFRMLAKQQFPDKAIVDMKWEQVEWPRWLWTATNNLWY